MALRTHTQATTHGAAGPWDGPSSKEHPARPGTRSLGGGTGGQRIVGQRPRPDPSPPGLGLEHPCWWAVSASETAGQGTGGPRPRSCLAQNKCRALCRGQGEPRTQAGVRACIPSWGPPPQPQEGLSCPLSAGCPCPTGRAEAWEGREGVVRNKAASPEQGHRTPEPRHTAAKCFRQPGLRLVVHPGSGAGRISGIPQHQAPQPLTSQHGLSGPQGSEAALGLSWS